MHSNLSTVREKFFKGLETLPGLIKLWNNAMHTLYTEIEFIVLAETMDEGWPLVKKLEKSGSTAFLLDPHTGARG